MRLDGFQSTSDQRPFTYYTVDHVTVHRVDWRFTTFTTGSGKSVY